MMVVQTQESGVEITYAYDDLSPTTRRLRRIDVRTRERVLLLPVTEEMRGLTPRYRIEANRRRSLDLPPDFAVETLTETRPGRAAIWRGVGIGLATLRWGL